MKSTLIASVLAAAMAFNGMGATAARAGSEDVAKVLAGAAALFIIGKAISGRNDDNTGYNNAVSRASHYNGDTFSRYDNDRRYRGDNRRSRRCLRQKNRNGRWVTYRDGRCMKRYNREAEKPRVCPRKRWTNNGWKKYYDRRCLRRHGSDVSRRDGYRWQRRAN